MVNIYTRYTIFNIFILISCVNCKKTTPNANEYLLLTYEKLNKTTTLKPVQNARSDLMSDLSEHVKEIFDAHGANSTYELNLNDKINDYDFTLSANHIEWGLIGNTTNKNKILAMFENITLTTPNYFTFSVSEPDIITTSKLSKTTRSILRKASKLPLTSTKKRKKLKTKPKTTTALLVRKTSVVPINPSNDQESKEQPPRKLSCIFCDNVNNKGCNNPERKLLPLVRCQHFDDQCYFMQTPFGIVDRGCYNPLTNHTTYVCSCNLCNSIPIHDLPYTYTNKSEWLTNVQEMANGKRLRKSVFKQMACVQCEVNQTIDEVPDINCLEGKYRVLPSQYCNSDEICGIRSIRNQGYIWRGCLKYPAYNYFWSFCENDLCNFETPTSLFDIK